MTDGNAGLSRRAFLTAAGTAVAATGTAAAQQEGNGTATGNQTTTASGGNATTTAAGNESTGNASAGGNESAGNESAGGNQSGGGNESSSGGSSGGMSKTVAVGPNGELVFDPAEVEVTPGSTITWVWESDTHNVIPESVPEGSSWKGSGSESETFDTGHEYSHTFETEGTYEYYCAPHKSAGMAGTITVSKDAGGGGGGGGGGGSSVPQVPDSAKSLGIATTLSMVSTLGLAYIFMKYGGDYGAEQ
jgi:plastocyanin